MSLKCVIIEDHQGQLQQLESFIKRTPGVVHAYSIDETQLNEAPRIQADVLVMNPSASYISSYHSLRLVREARYIIMLLPKKQTELKAKNNMPALSFLNSPLSYNHFVDQLKTAETYLSEHDSSPVGYAFERSPEADKYFYVKSDSKYVKLCYNEVLMIEGMRDFSKIFTNDKTYTVLVNLKNLEAQLPKDMYYRSHRSYIVNLNRISSIEGETIHIDQLTAQLGLGYRDKLISFITNKLVTRTA